MLNEKYKWVIAGIIFSILWGSASTATKIALGSSQPLVIALMRFIIAAFTMLFVAHGILRRPLPQNKLWRRLAIYGLLNITIYLGLYIIAMKHVTASIGALTVATNPIFISVFSLLFLKKPITKTLIISLLIGIAGIVVVAIPYFKDASVTLLGLVLILLSMVSYSAANIYFSAKEWGGMKILVINGWQTFFGGLFLAPFVIFSYENTLNNFDIKFWGGVVWLAIAVSIGAVVIWLWLLQKDAVKAGLWLFLCPVFGIIIAAAFVGDAINIYTIVGLVMVLGGLALSHFKPGNVKQVE